MGTRACAERSRHQCCGVADGNGASGCGSCKEQRVISRVDNRVRGQRCVKQHRLPLSFEFVAL